ncbi:MAG TPA: polysaccharide biosynthesis/export family protein [Terriglobales bacterium]|nr:polysaccharide biosynthesis/export family protein [Terriglobales bacterium]
MIRSRRLAAASCIIIVLFFLTKTVVGEEMVRDAVRIGVGDLLEIAVFDTPELSAKVRVDATGDVLLPLVGRVHMDGLSPAEAQAAIAKHLLDGDFVKDPQVVVAVVEYGAQGITVLGEVKKPGVYPPSSSRTLMEVLSRAEGLTQFAAQTVLIRHRSDPEHPIKVRLTESPEKMEGAVTEVLPGDVVFVPKAGLVYVVGDVSKPGGFVMDGDRTTVLQALALAGGLNRTAAASKSRIIRKAETGPEEISVDLKKLLASKIPDAQMRPGDILFVPGSTTKGALKRSAEAVLQVATGVIIYRR